MESYSELGRFRHDITEEDLKHTIVVVHRLIHSFGLQEEQCLKEADKLIDKLWVKEK